MISFGSVHEALFPCPRVASDSVVSRVLGAAAVTEQSEPWGLTGATGDGRWVGAQIAWVLTAKGADLWTPLHMYLQRAILRQQTMSSSGLSNAFIITDGDLGSHLSDVRCCHSAMVADPGQPPIPPDVSSFAWFWRSRCLICCKPTVPEPMPAFLLWAWAKMQTNTAAGAFEGRAQCVCVAAFSLRTLCRAIARVGCGATEFLKFAPPNPSPPLPPRFFANLVAACDRQLRRAFQPAISNVSIDWVMGGNSQAQQAPAAVSTVFEGERVIVYVSNVVAATVQRVASTRDALVSPNEMVHACLDSYAFADHCQRAVLRGSVTDAMGNTKSFETFVSTTASAHRQGDMLHTLAARKMIQDWEDGSYDDEAEQHMLQKRKRKQELIGLSLNYQVVTKWTSFVAVEDRTEEERRALASGNNAYGAFGGPVFIL